MKPAFIRLSCAALLLCANATLAAAPAAALAADLAQEAPPLRLISVGGGVTEIVYALEAQHLLVAVDTSSHWPPVARTLPKIGYQGTLAAEGVLSLDPAVLLASHEAGPPAALRQIEDAGVQVVRVRNDYSFPGLLARVRLIAGSIDREEAGEALVARLEARWAQVRDTLQAHPPRSAHGGPMRVAFLMLHGPVVAAAGRDTGADALLGHLGAVNVFAQDFANYKPLSVESLIAADPDFIVVTVDSSDQDGALERLHAIPGAQVSRAIREGRVAAIDIVYALGFGPRLPDVVTELHRSLTQ